MSAVPATREAFLDAELFLVKTDKGQDEIRNRTAGLSPRLRSLLVMIDGSKPAAEIVRCATGLGGGLDFVQALLDGGFVRPLGRDEAQLASDSVSGVAAPVASPPPAVPASVTPGAHDSARVAKGKAVLRRFIKLAPVSDARALNRAVDAVHGVVELDGAARVVAGALTAAGNPEAAATMHAELARA